MLVLSVSFEHYAVRESEIDTLWSLADVASRAGDPGADYALVLLWEAHEALAHERLDDASRALEALEAHLRRGSTDPSSPVSSR